MLIPNKRHRRLRVRITASRGKWKAVALGMFGAVISESPAGRLDEAEQYARNYERTRAWLVS